MSLSPWLPSLFDMSQSRRRAALYNRLRRATRGCLSSVDQRDQDAFNKWLAQHKSSKHSQLTDLPSTKIIPKMSLIKANSAQLFVVIDTCSIVQFRSEFIDYVVRLKSLFSRGSCPIKIIISLVVLEELDKCNRPNKKRQPQQQPQVKLEEQARANSQQASPGKVLLRNKNDHSNNLDPKLEDLIDAANKNAKTSEPPRMFMRFIEEEMRTSEVIISELDPFKQTKLSNKELAFDVVNMDDRILDCCLRSRAFIQAHPHHLDTQVILLTEDNVFKSKATTFEIASYRWREFKAKFKNFGLEHYISTPLFGSTNVTFGASNNSKTSEDGTRQTSFRFNLLPERTSNVNNVIATPSTASSKTTTLQDEKDTFVFVPPASLDEQVSASPAPSITNPGKTQQKGSTGRTVSTCFKRVAAIKKPQAGLGSKLVSQIFNRPSTAASTTAASKLAARLQSIDCLLNDESVVFLEEVINIK